MDGQIWINGWMDGDWVGWMDGWMMTEPVGSGCI